MPQSQIGLVGLGAMGGALARNLAGKGIRVCVYNRTKEKTAVYLKEFGSDELRGETELPAFIASLARPRMILLMVQAGAPVDATIQALLPLLEKGDIIVDCGNSHYRDTARRTADLAAHELLFFGCGVSGGTVGALHGPSLMPGGPKEAWKHLRPFLQKIAAKDFAGRACVGYLGSGGAGHYVKMVHNGIEYGVMQLLAEAYDLLRSLYGLSSPEIAEIFQNISHGNRRSYLFDIAIPVLQKKDDMGRGYLVDHIRDAAGHKGTGTWTTVDALERGVAVPTMAAAVFARALSADTALRERLSKQYKKRSGQPTLSQKTFVSSLQHALSAAIISTYAQGFALIRQAAQEEKWSVELVEVARIWQGGCIIRAAILQTISKVYEKAPGAHVFEHKAIATILKPTIPALRTITAAGCTQDLPIPAFGASLSYIYSVTAKKLPANFIQGLRDYFGAHGFERIDRPGSFHGNWDVQSS